MNNKWMESGFMLIHQVAHLAKYQTLKEMESCGLKPNQAGILFVLRSEGGLSQRELAKRMGVTPPSMTAALKKMEKQGYVLREQDEKDQRITRIRISDQGIECLNGLQHMMRNLEKRLYEGISAEERQEMKETLLKMRENVAKAINADIDCVSIKATTEEGLGFTGNKEGISSQAICSLIKVDNK